MPLTLRAAALVVGLIVASVPGLGSDDLRKDFSGGGWHLGAGGQRVGDEVAFALPGYDNDRDEPITIRSVHVLEVPPGWTILGYGLLRVEPNGSFAASWGSRYSPRRYDPRPRFRPIAGYTVGPHQRADHYGMVWARIDALPVANLRGVETLYSVGGSTRWVRSDVEYGAEADG